MTRERAVWEGGWTHDTRFTSALRIDPLLLDWPQACAATRRLGLRGDGRPDRPHLGGSAPVPARLDASG